MGWGPGTMPAMSGSSADGSRGVRVAFSCERFSRRSSFSFCRSRRACSFCRLFERTSAMFDLLNGGAALLESFETAAALAPWHAATWAEATLDAAGQPAAVSRAAFGATAGASALSINVRFTGAGYEQGYVGREGLSLSLAGCAGI